MDEVPKVSGGRTWARAERKRLLALQAERVEAKQAAKADAFVQAFVDMTPAQVVAYVASNVTDLASARQLLTKMALMLLLLAKKEFKE